MTSTDLIDTLYLKLNEIFSGWLIPGKGGIELPIAIFKQYMPQSTGLTGEKGKGLSGYVESDYMSNFPCVVIQHSGTTDQEQGRTDQSMTAITLKFGIYDEAAECQGYRDLLNMIDAVRQSFLTERIIGGKFWLAMPVRSKLLDDDTWPVYLGQMDMTFATGRPVMGRDYLTKEAIPWIN